MYLPDLLNQRVHVALLVAIPTRRSEDDDDEQRDEILVNGLHF